MSTTVPREALIRIEPGFINASSSAPIIFLVDRVSGTCSVTTSLMLSKSDRWRTCWALPNGSLFSIS
ncbi:hypothetical protein D3C86_2243930 [compost metagenome]